MNCPKCGAAIADDSAFCSKCGAYLAETTAVQVQEPVQQQEPGESAPPEPETPEPAFEAPRQESTTPPPPPSPNTAQTYLTQNILLTVFSVICCMAYALPTAVTGLVFSAIADGARKQGEMARFEQYRKLARIFMWISFGLEIAVAAVSIVGGILFAVSGVHSFGDTFRQYFDPVQKFRQPGMEIVKKTFYIAAPILAGLAIFLLPYIQPFYRCVFYDVTGLFCAGCGGTRAALALLRGDFAAALHDNALLVLLLPAALYMYAAGFIRTFFHKDTLPLPRNAAPWLWGLLVLVALFMIVRNIGIPPFTFLKPL